MSDKVKNLLAELKQSQGIGSNKNTRHADLASASGSSAAEKKDELPTSKNFTILCIGASTGGPSAVQLVLQGLGENFPLPVLYAQHLDVGADDKMAKWFSDTCPNIPVTLAKDGEIAQPGHAYLAPAEKHLVIDRVKNGLPVLKLSDEPPERFLRPAVNKLFRSAAKFYKQSCLAILMTGMGADGAEGCKEIIDAGGYTICEDKSTCKVFGMPAAAIAMNAASKVLPRGEVAPTILKLVK
ncbi:CheB methylesterase domain-containing protein [Treponema zioleckii]|uniref:CheB methylesterase domain-containing protein n=1 Tax=Treponema zioleckii TaxID=331680 RepID=UPI00168AD24D|nr:CheB methylesterase domain-containing protein [Treponema zioleckii]